MSVSQPPSSPDNPLTTGMPSAPVRHKRPFATLRAVMALMLREMATTYGRSPGGYLWAILEPVAAIALLTAVFSTGFRAPPIGNNFPIFYATGMLPFQLYISVSGPVAASILFSKALLAYPSVTYIDAILGRFLLNLMTQLLVSALVFVAILSIFETRTILDVSLLIQAYALAALLALGIGTLNCFLFSIVPVWQRVWSVVNRPLFILSCIFFTFDSIPLPYRDWLWYNPLVHIVGLARAAFYPSYEAQYASPLYVAVVGAVSLLAGLVFLHRYHREILNN